MAVDETSGRTDNSTSCEVPGRLQETGWEALLRSEQKRIDRGTNFTVYLRMVVLFFSWAIVLCACICCVECRHNISLYFSVFFVCTTVPHTRLLAYVCCACRIQQCMCSSH